MDDEVRNERYRVSVRPAGQPDRRIVEVCSLRGAGHAARHTTYLLRRTDGSLIPDQPITVEAARVILRQFANRGETEAFTIDERLLMEDGRDMPRTLPPAAEPTSGPLSPSGIRHRLTREERSFTATGEKLLYHWPIFAKYRDTGFGSIIRATMTNHQVCSSRCPYCSTIARARSDSITLDEAKHFVRTLYDEQAAFNRERFASYNDAYREITGSDIRLRGLILSGGGQPNLWKHFVPFVEWLSERDIDLGLITNGFPPAVDEAVYRHFAWVRISITPETASPFYPGGRFDRQYIPETIRHNPAITVGYSCVWGPWIPDEMLLRIRDSMEEHGFDYCRLLTDCNLSRSAQLEAHHGLAETMHRLGFTAPDGTPTGKFFHQLKYHANANEIRSLWDEGQCYLQIYNVFWDTTGHDVAHESHCYPCDSVTVLTDENEDGAISTSERCFDPSKWGTVRNTEVARLFTEPLRPFFDPNKLCRGCLFFRNNQVIKALIRRTDPPQPPDRQIRHVNFP